MDLWSSSKYLDCLQATCNMQSIKREVQQWSINFAIFKITFDHTSFKALKPVFNQPLWQYPVWYRFPRRRCFPLSNQPYSHTCPYSYNNTHTQALSLSKWHARLSKVSKMTAVGSSCIWRGKLCVIWPGALVIMENLTGWFLGQSSWIELWFLSNVPWHG